MTAEHQPSHNATHLERTYDAAAKLIWELWTTAGGIEEWWTPQDPRGSRVPQRFAPARPVRLEIGLDRVVPAAALEILDAIRQKYPTAVRRPHDENARDVVTF